MWASRNGLSVRNTCLAGLYADIEFVLLRLEEIKQP